MTHHRWFTYALVVAVFALAGCGSPKSPFVGKWVGLDGRVEIEFFSDQTALITEADDPETIAGTWLVLEDGRIKFDFTQRGEAEIITGVLEEEQIVFTLGGRSIAFQRAEAAGSFEDTSSQVRPSAPEDASAAAARLRAQCANQLKQIGLGMKMYANESRGVKYPPLASKRGSFIMAPTALYPEYLVNTDVYFCPACKETKPPAGTINDDCYWYLGYTMHDEATGIAFLEAYGALPKDEDYPDYFELDEVLPNGLTQIHMLRDGIERYLITDINDPRQSSGLQSKIPVMVEKPEKHGGGGNVLFLDGHVEYIKYPGKFPMTEAFIEGLRAIEKNQH